MNSGNNMTGTLPDVWKAFPRLRYLWLKKEAGLSGKMPQFQGNPRLECLHLSETSISGKVPDVKDKPALRELMLESLPIHGTIPDFKNNPNLKMLGLSNTSVTGTLPDFKSNPELQQVSLDHSYSPPTTGKILALHLPAPFLTGVLPDFTANPNLTVLKLGGHGINGSMPSFAVHSKLLLLVMTGLSITGTIPSFTNNPSLQTLYLLNLTRVSGALPNFEANPDLEILQLQSLPITGAFPNFSRNSKLKVLAASGTKVAGNLDLILAPSTSTVLLQGNDIFGRLSCPPPTLRVLVVSSNFLHGHMPECSNTSLHLLWAAAGNRLIRSAFSQLVPSWYEEDPLWHSSFTIPASEKWGELLLFTVLLIALLMSACSVLPRNVRWCLWSAPNSTLGVDRFDTSVGTLKFAMSLLTVPALITLMVLLDENSSRFGSGDDPNAVNAAFLQNNVACGVVFSWCFAFPVLMIGTLRSQQQNIARAGLGGLLAVVSMRTREITLAVAVSLMLSVPASLYVFVSASAEIPIVSDLKPLFLIAATLISVKKGELIGQISERSVQVFAGLTSWFLPAVIVIALDENCYGAWKVFWAKCASGSTGFDVCGKDAGLHEGYSNLCLMTTQQMCDSRWQQVDRCTIGVISQVSDLAIFKGLTAACIPLLLILFMALTKRFTQIGCKRICLRRIEEDFGADMVLSVCSRQTKVLSCFQPLNMAAYITVWTDLCMVWGLFSPFALASTLIAIQMQQFACRVAQEWYGFKPRLTASVTVYYHWVFCGIISAFLLCVLHVASMPGVPMTLRALFWSTPVWASIVYKASLRFCFNRA